MLDIEFTGPRIPMINGSRGISWTFAFAIMMSPSTKPLCIALHAKMLGARLQVADIKKGVYKMVGEQFGARVLEHGGSSS